MPFPVLSSLYLRKRCARAEVSPARGAAKDIFRNLTIPFTELQIPFTNPPITFENLLKGPNSQDWHQKKKSKCFLESQLLTGKAGKKMLQYGL